MTQHLDIHATHWQREGAPSESRVVMGIWGGLILAILGLVILSAHFLTKNQPAEKSEKTENYALPSFEGAKTIFVVTNKPSEQLLKDLETASQNGTKVQLITTEQIPVPFNTTVVDPKRIVRNAILINGAAWYLLPP